MVALDEWIGETSLRLNGCPYPVVLQALRRGAQQFCRDTRLWVQTMGTATVSPSDDYDRDIEVDLPSADYVVPDMAQIIDIEDLIIEDKPIQKLVGDNPFRYSKFQSKIFINPRAVNQDSDLEVIAAFEPTDTATDIPDALIEWKLTVTDRALYELMLMPNKDWTDAPTAVKHEKNYNTRVAAGTVAKAKQNSRLPVRTARIPFL